jgi:hypothetical protein
MKKIILTAFLTLAGLVHAQNIVFADPALKAYLLSANATNNIAFIGFTDVDIDTNGDNEISMAEAAPITRLWIESPGITGIGGIENFTGLDELAFQGTGVTSATVNAMPNLAKLQFTSNPSLTSVSATNLAGLVQLSVSDNPLMATVDMSGTDNIEIFIGNNSAITALDFSGKSSLVDIYANDNQLASLNVSGCTALHGIGCTGNLLTALDVSGLTILASVQFNDNPALVSVNAAGCAALAMLDNPATTGCPNVTAVDLSGCTALTGLSFNGGVLESLDVSGCNMLINLTASNNSLTDLDVAGCTLLNSLVTAGNGLTALDLSSCTNLQTINVSNNPIASLDISGCTGLTDVSLESTQLASFDISGFPNLQNLSLAGNNSLTALDVSGCPLLANLNIDNAGAIETFDASNCTSLPGIAIDSDNIQSVNVQGCTGLENLWVNGSAASGAPLSTLDLSGLASLTQLQVGGTNLADVNLDGCAALSFLWCKWAAATAIDLSDCVSLTNASFQGSAIESLDLSLVTSPSLFVEFSDCTALKAVFAKNGIDEGFIFDQDNGNLNFVCQDDAFVAHTLSALDIIDDHEVVCNSYCSFTPGGDYNTISGTVSFDLNGDGCDPGDIIQPNLRVDIADGMDEGATFTDDQGQYAYYVGAGNYTLAPALENPSIFGISPASAAIAFADTNNSTAAQDFCLTAVGSANDIEIVVAPIVPARPGFVAVYEIVIRNKGNQTLSGSYTFNYDEALMDFTGAGTAPDVVAAGSLSWNYSDLLPFENRSVAVLMEINTPTETPPVSIDDILTFTANIDPVASDINPLDNAFALGQTVVGSYDPNDIKCLEGETVPPSEIGKYLHYVVNFENTGNSAAENVVVKIDVDPTQYDVHSLQLLNTSYAARTVITGNKMEFLFEGINLAAVAGDPPVGGHGNVLFKIKTLPTLQTGDQVNKFANIFFDYNAPIETPDAETTFASLNNPDFETDESIVVHPNPARDVIHIEGENVIRGVELFDIQGRLLESAVLNAARTQIDVSGRPRGIYFVRIATDAGKKVEKILVE